MSTLIDMELDKIAKQFKRGLILEEEVHLKVVDKIKKMNGTINDYWAFCDRNHLEPLSLVFDSKGCFLIEDYVYNFNV